MLLIAFNTTDLFIFYLAFKGISIPVFLLIFLYSAEITKIKASLYYIIYSFLSSTFLAIAIFLLYIQFSTSNITILCELMDSYSLKFLYSLNKMYIIYFCLLLSFLIKLPLVPFHMQLPEAHAEAPTSRSVMLTRAILKLSGYSLYKFFLPLFRNFTYFNPIIYTLTLFSIFFIRYSCIKSNHIKQIIAYSSIMHMNVSCLSLFINKTFSVIRSIYSMISHSLISSSLFILASILYNRYDSYLIETFGSLMYSMPYFSLFFVFNLFANISIPLTSSFIPELLVLLDISKYNIFIFFIFITYFLLVTTYSIFLLNKILFNDVKIKTTSSYTIIKYIDLSILEIRVLGILMIAILLLSIIPSSFYIHYLLI